MATTDTSAAIKAIRDLYCDAEATLEVLAALSNAHADWLKGQDLEVLGNDGLRLMDEAQDALGEFHDDQRAARRAGADYAADVRHEGRVFVCNTGAAAELLKDAA